VPDNFGVLPGSGKIEMHKIPVGQTIALAYRFLFLEIGTILGICWFPALLSSLASYLTALYAAMHAEQIQARELGPEIAYGFVSAMGIAITIFAASVMAVALTRHVLGRRATGVVAYFAVGPAEWRMFGAIVRYIAGSIFLIFVAITISALALNLAGVPVDSAGAVRVTAPNIIAVVIAWAAFIGAFIMMLRIGFFIPASIVAEEHGGLRRSFELTRGNVLRSLAVLAVLGAPVLFLLLGGEAVLLRSALGPALYRMPPAEFFERATQAMQQKLVPWEVFSAIIFVLGSALIYGGSALAYRARLGIADIRDM
jgi:hypothetical protein